MHTFANQPRTLKALTIGGLIAGARTVGLSKPLATLVCRTLFSGRRKSRIFAGYRATHSDVFVTTFSKSGTNLLLQMALQAAWHGGVEFEHIHELVAWPDVSFPGIVPLRHPGPQTQSPSGLRIIKTSAPGYYVPYSPESRYITVLRDPKEVCVSSYFFILTTLGLIERISLDEWLDVFLAPGSLATSWAEHTSSFWRWRGRPNFLFIDFATAVGDPSDTLRRVTRLMALSLTEAQLASVAERCSFAYMQRHDRKFGPPHIPFTRQPARMVRSGKSGASGRFLNSDQQAAIDRHCLAELRRLGSTFPYAERFQRDSGGPA